MFHHINIQGEHAPFANTASDSDLDLKSLRLDVRFKMLPIGSIATGIFRIYIYIYIYLDIV